MLRIAFRQRRRMVAGQRIDTAADINAVAVEAAIHAPCGIAATPE